MCRLEGERAGSRVVCIAQKARFPACLSISPFTSERISETSVSCVPGPTHRTSFRGGWTVWEHSLAPCPAEEGSES